MAIDKKTLEIVITGDVKDANEAFETVKDSLVGIDTELSKLVTEYDVLTKKSRHLVNVVSTDAGNLGETFRNIQESFKRIHVDAEGKEYKHGVTVAKVEASPLRHEQEQIKLAQKRLAQIEATRLKEAKLEVKLSEKIAAARKKQSDLEEKQAAQSELARQRAFIDRLNDFRQYSNQYTDVIKQHWAANKAVFIDGINSEKSILARAQARELEARQGHLKKVAELQEKLVTGQIEPGTAKRDLRNITTATTAELQRINKITAEQLKEVKAPIIDWSERKALLDKELTYEAAQKSKYRTEEKSSAAKHAWEKLKIEQEYAANLRNIQQQLRVGTITAVQATAQQTEALNKYGEAIKNLPPLDEHVHQHRNLIAVIMESTIIYRVFTTLWEKVFRGFQAVPEIGIQLEATVASLTSTLRSADAAKGAIAALNKEAQRTGITLTALRDSFRVFQASTSLAGVSLERTWQMFTNVNTVSTALHLTTEQVNRVFMALAQMFNKSKIQAEELVKQLGNLLPGAFAAFARANRLFFTGPQDLAVQMRRGLVFTQDTMDNFLNYYATTFQQAFAGASQGLKANVGRLQNSFHLLGETLYGIVRESLQTIVLSLTDAANAINKAISGTNHLTDALRILTHAGIGLAVGSLISLVSKITTTVTVLGTLKAAWAFISTPTAIIAGLTLIGLELDRIVFKQERATKSAEKFLEQLRKAEQEATLAAKLNITELAAGTVTTFNEQLKKLDEIIAQRTQKVSDLKHTLAQDKSGILEAGHRAALEYETKELQKAFDLHTELARRKEQTITAARALAEHDRDTKSIEATQRYLDRVKELELTHAREYGDASVAARLEAEKTYAGEIRRNIAVLNELLKTPEKERKDHVIAEIEALQTLIGWQKKMLELAGTEVRQPAAVARVPKIDTTFFRDIEREIQAHKTVTETSLEELDTLYKTNTLSIKDYTNKKKQLLQEQFEKEAAFLNKSRDFAKVQGDLNRVEEFNDKIRQAKLDRDEKLSAARNREIEELKNLTDAIEKVNIAYDKKHGIEVQAEKFLKTKQRLEIEPQTPEITTARERIREIVASDQALRIAQREHQDTLTQRQVTSEEIQRINTLQKVGAISQIQAMRKINDLYEEQIAAMRESIRIQEEALVKAPQDAEIGRQLEILKRTKAELEVIEATAETVGNQIQNSIGLAFENSFAALLDGTQTGQEAFHGFVNSVIKDINRMVASEIHSSILRPLLKGGAKFVVDLFTGGSEALFQAKGGINSNMGIGKGIILDSPTYFPNAKPVPFARGGVVAGEAGKEAVLPLVRNREGKLGVISTNNETFGQSPSIVIQSLSVQVIEKEETTSEEQAKLIGETIKLNLKGLIQNELARAVRSGGQLNPTQLTASF